jgi:16S rRNA (adenine1518-N6/adenine1519-N6)-dimethyltransferase
VNQNSSRAEGVAQLLRRHGLRPDKRLGQSFLVDSAALERVVRAAELRPDETVLEIGAGLGTLTARLSASAKRVVAVEVDRRLIPVLERELGGCSNVEIVQGDALQIDLAAVTRGEAYVVVANIPYLITSALIRRLLEAGHPPGRMVLTLQAEVGERIVAGPGEMSLLALSVQLYGAPRLAAHIPASAFYPRPEVESVVLRIDRHALALMPLERVPDFFRMARAGFSQRRKMLRNAAAGGLAVEPSVVASWMQAAGLAATARAQELGLDDWDRLVGAAIADGWRGEG